MQNRYRRVGYRIRRMDGTCEAPPTAQDIKAILAFCSSCFGLGIFEGAELLFAMICVGWDGQAELSIGDFERAVTCLVNSEVHNQTPSVAFAKIPREN